MLMTIVVWRGRDVTLASIRGWAIGPNERDVVRSASVRGNVEGSQWGRTEENL